MISALRLGGFTQFHTHAHTLSMCASLSPFKPPRGKKQCGHQFMQELQHTTQRGTLIMKGAHEILQISVRLDAENCETRSQEACGRARSVWLGTTTVSRVRSTPRQLPGCILQLNVQQKKKQKQEKENCRNIMTKLPSPAIVFCYPACVFLGVCNSVE